jgi:hypothetical protein
MSDPISLPVSFVDAQGYGWTINEDGSVESSVNPDFRLSDLDSYELKFSDSGFEDTTSEDGGREIVIGPRPLVYTGSGGYYATSVIRKIYVSPSQGWIRFLEIVTNDETSATSIYIPIQSHLTGHSETVQTSDGDISVEVSDQWLITNDTEAATPPLAQVLFGSGGYRPSYVYSRQGNEFNRSEIEQLYRLDLEPGETKIVMHFMAFDPTVAGAVTKADALKVLSLDALEGISLAEKERIINFDLGVNGAVLPPDLAVTAAAIAGGSNKINIGLSAAIEWTVKNVGESALHEGTYDSILFSENAQLEGSDPSLTDYPLYAYTDLAPGETLSRRYETRIPIDLPIGQQNLIIQVGSPDYVSERNEANNVFVLPVEVTAPDLIIRPTSTVGVLYQVSRGVGG